MEWDAKSGLMVDESDRCYNCAMLTAVDRWCPFIRHLVDRKAVLAEPKLVIKDCDMHIPKLRDE